MTRPGLIMFVGLAVSALAAIVCSAWGLMYELKAGAVARVPERLPALEEVRTSHFGVMVIAVHPSCPCTLATVETVQRLLGSAPVIPVVALVTTYGEVVGMEGELVERLDRMGVTLVGDEAGATARKLGMLTSGHVLLYDSGGRLAFSGGVTPGRGYSGGGGPAFEAMNAALERVVEDWGISGAAATAPVYGCALASMGHDRGCGDEAP